MIRVVVVITVLAMMVMMTMGREEMGVNGPLLREPGQQGERGAGASSPQWALRQPPGDTQQQVHVHI